MSSSPCLTSSNPPPAPNHAFEGPEKLLEMWFKADPDGEMGVQSLRSVSKEVWAEMLCLVHCTILNHISNDFIDAYLLSESSFFVFQDRIILKTCGTTTLLGAVTKILEIARSCGLTVVEDVFYSRQNFFFPEKQLAPHSSFVSETAFLDKIFDHGCAYKVGRTNGSHYNMYNAENRSSTPEHDATIEILMCELDPELMKKYFYKNSFSSTTSKECGIVDLLPGAIIDEFIFEPFGYSMNGILGEAYCTIHVTPQPGCSYASFETNLIMDDYTDLIKKVLAVFNPSAFMVSTVVNDQNTGLNNDVFSNKCRIKRAEFEDFTLGDRAIYHFQHYDLTFLAFRKNGTEPPFSENPHTQKNGVAKPGIMKSEEGKSQSESWDRNVKPKKMML